MRNLSIEASADDISRLLKDKLRETGCAAAAAIPVAEIDSDSDLQFRSWLAAGRHAGMSWLEQHADLRMHPRAVMPDARTVICFAFRFPKPKQGSLRVAAYALGRDYHKALKSRLKHFCEALEKVYDCHTRICVDSAPIAERQWAFRAGIASPGCNGMALVPGCGPYSFLAEVVTDLSFDRLSKLYYQSSAQSAECMGCMQCVAACPTGALSENGSVDARICLSYLSIEHRGEFDDETLDRISRMDASFPLLGCDRCLSACPLSDGADAPVIPDLQPRRELMAITPQSLMQMSDSEIDVLTAGTSLRRPGADSLRRNARISITKPTR